MKAQVLGLGWVTASGIGRGGEHVVFSLSAGTLPQLKRKDVFSEPYKRFGRLDDFSRLGLSGIALALQDAGLDRWQEKRNIGVIASTRFGCVATDLAYFDTVIPEGGALASPNLFAYTLSNTFLGEAAIRFGLTGTGFVVNEEDPERLAGLRMALESLEWGECDTVVAGFCDLPSPEGLVPGGAPAPGAVFLVLGEGPEGEGGQLAISDQGGIRVGAVVVKDWTGLVQACLSPEVS